MKLNPTILFRIGAILGFLGVAAGAFGAHALKDSFGPYEIDIWKTASMYHLLHVAVGLFAISIERYKSALCFLIGLTVFSTSLYALAITGIKVLGAITPIGGVLLLIGWLSLFFSFSTKKV